MIAFCPVCGTEICWARGDKRPECNACKKKAAKTGKASPVAIDSKKDDPDGPFLIAPDPDPVAPAKDLNAEMPGEDDSVPGEPPILKIPPGTKAVPYERPRTHNRFRDSGFHEDGK